jgi:tetratricopeptide (TPR) repeat protein
VPEIAVEMSAKEYANNQDLVMHAILSYSSSVPQTLDKIRTQVEQGVYEKAEKTAFEFLHDPANKYLNINAQLNSMGYELMNNKKLKAAVATFEINTKLYPESANAWDSLAECYLNSHDYKKAIMYYEKAIKMDPDGGTGAHAQEMLDKIKAHMGN